MLPRSRGVPLENPSQTDPWVVFFLGDCITASLYAKFCTSLPRQGHFTRWQRRRLHIFTAKRKFGNFTPPPPPCPCLLVVFYCGTAPLHRFTAKALQTLGVAHRRKPPIILTVSHNSHNSHHAPASAALHTAVAQKKPVRLRRTGFLNDPKMLHQTD